MFVSIKKMLLTTAVLGAVIPASASAMIYRESPIGASQVAVPAEVVAPAPQSGGFQWGDAGIGAAGMLTLLAAGGGLGVGARRRSHRRGLAAS